MKNYIISIVIGFVLMGAGIGFLSVEVMDYDYVDTLPTNVSTGTKTVEYSFDTDTLYVSSYFDDVTFVPSNDIEEGNIKMEITYYNGIYDITTSKVNREGNEVVTFYKNDKVSSIKYMYNLVIANLKDKKVYNYALMDNVTAKVYINKADINKVKSYDDAVSHEFTIEDNTVICAPAMEEIARDDEYIYYLGCIKSTSIYLVYSDGTRISLRSALNTGRVTIYELIEEGLEIYKEANDKSL